MLQHGESPLRRSCTAVSVQLLNDRNGPGVSWRAHTHTARNIAGSASCAQLPVVSGMATYGFQKMLKVQWCGTVRHLPTQTDRPKTRPAVCIVFRYRLRLRKGRSLKNTNTLKILYFLNAPF